MNIKEIRQITGLSQKAFCELYDIPLSTLKNWEASPGKKNHRECPIYVVKLLEKAVKYDFRCR